ncbi:MAG: TonB-dependent receptor [Phenylobacterium sp.]|uniref:TonB-dependent receptor domain-containing protein n=1 Tax=Phenylobacterium sp. TaxID=1871053 RepID=UPI002733EA9D|nr:TonB-dependent receptor [Phenylobacterium sp.]MDP3175425.1 TonB-dependent receptor [Phenylobacterium sp.]
MNSQLLGRGSSLAIIAAASLWAGAASAQQAGGEVSEVVVTGSFIAGTPEDAALPVDVIGADELQRQGNPTTVELMKNLSASSGVQGDQNQYSGANGNFAGVASVNLRGLGPQRTLVLLNGKRLVATPDRNGFVDLNLLPQAAIGRIEVLKDGAAATYGSDAIGGVVNFITRKNFEGLQVSADYRYVADADSPDYTASAIWGWSGDRGNILLSAGWQERGRLRGNARDFNIDPYTPLSGLISSDAGFSSTNNPGQFRLISGATTVGAQIRDPGCTTVGAIAGFTGGLQSCFPRHAGVHVHFIDPSDRWQVFGETNFDLSDNVKFHAEAFYAETYVRTITSAAYPSTNSTPTANTSPIPGAYYVPATNPGLALLMQQFPGAFPAGTTGVAYQPGVNFRPFGLGGNPLFGGDGNTSTVNNKYYRVSGGFSGKMFDDSIGWDLSATFNTYNLRQNQSDDLVYRQELALRGYGSLGGAPNCTASVTNNFTTNAGNNAVGCYYFNPFSNSFAANSIISQENPGRANPLYSPSVANNIELVKWIWQKGGSDRTSRLFVVDGVFNGELPFLELGGGKIGWAAGGQFRRNFYRTSYAPFYDATVNPCPETPFTGSKTCAGTPGPNALQPVATPSNVVQNIYAGFAEVSLPFTDNFGAHIAARYENYGADAGGDTFNPKLDVRWQVADWLALRGSVGTTFRAPPLPLIDPAPSVQLLNLALVGFRAVSTTGNSDLKPETATTYSLGAIVEAGPFKGTLDYWNFDIQDPFVPEPAQAFIDLMFPGGSSVNCNNPTFTDLQARFTFDPNVCGLLNFNKLALTYVNAGGQKTDGVDGTAEFAFEDVYGGGLRMGAQASWLHKYDYAEIKVRGVTVAPAVKAAGLLNYNKAGYFSLPRWKGNVFAEWDSGPHNIRVQTNYIGSMTDERVAPFSPANPIVIGDVATAAQATVVPRSLQGKKIDAFVTTDVTYRVFLPWDTTAVFNVTNIFDTDPSFARVELSYDATTGNALGRTYKVALTKKF